MFGTYLAAEEEASSSHLKTKCVMNFSTSLDEPSLVPTYAENPSSTRTEAYQRRRYYRGVIYWRQEVVYSFEAYGKARLTP